MKDNGDTVWKKLKDLEEWKVKSGG